MEDMIDVLAMGQVLVVGNVLLHQGGEPVLVGGHQHASGRLDLLVATVTRHGQVISSVGGQPGHVGVRGAAPLQGLGLDRRLLRVAETHRKLVEAALLALEGAALQHQPDGRVGVELVVPVGRVVVVGQIYRQTDHDNRPEVHSVGFGSKPRRGSPHLADRPKGQGGAAPWGTPGSGATGPGRAGLSGPRGACRQS